MFSVYFNSTNRKSPASRECPKSSNPVRWTSGIQLSISEPRDILSSDSSDDSSSLHPAFSLRLRIFYCFPSLDDIFSGLLVAIILFPSFYLFRRKKIFFYFILIWIFRHCLLTNYTIIVFRRSVVFICNVSISDS